MWEPPMVDVNNDSHITKQFNHYRYEEESDSFGRKALTKSNNGITMHLAMLNSKE